MRQSTFILALAFVAGGVFSVGGCLEREMTITSEPSGALVYLSKVEKGRTPLTIPFTWYGDYDVELRMEGYKTLKTHANLTAPYWELPPIDLFATVVPWTYTDKRYLTFKLEKYQVPSDDDLIRRAVEMRKENLKAATQP